MITVHYDEVCIIHLDLIVTDCINFPDFWDLKQIHCVVMSFRIAELAAELIFFSEIGSRLTFLLGGRQCNMGFDCPFGQNGAGPPLWTSFIVRSRGGLQACKLHGSKTM